MNNIFFNFNSDLSVGFWPRLTYQPTSAFHIVCLSAYIFNGGSFDSYISYVLIVCLSADICNPLLRFDICAQWAERILYEFYYQVWKSLLHMRGYARDNHNNKNSIKIKLNNPKFYLIFPFLYVFFCWGRLN